MLLTHKDDLPYEKFIKYGPESLTDAELLAIIIRTGTKNESPVSLGQQILDFDENHWGLSWINHCVKICTVTNVPVMHNSTFIFLLSLIEIPSLLVPDISSPFIVMFSAPLISKNGVFILVRTTLPPDDGG